MGTLTAEIEIGDPSGSHSQTVNALVDTGTSVSTLPVSILDGLGEVPHTKFTFAMADGWEIQQPVRRTLIRTGDRSEFTLSYSQITAWSTCWAPVPCRG